MVNYRSGRLDTVFAALSDATRRGVLAALASESRSAGELAQPYAISLPAFLKHLRVLEDAGLVETRKEGRVVRCTLAPKAMREASEWLNRYERFWGDRLDALARYLDEEEKRSWPKAPSSSARPSSSSATTRRRRKKSGAR
jgi:DNA-binding transcriptional ArsR family regulator